MAKRQKHHQTITIVAPGSPECEIELHINHVPSGKTTFTPGYAYTSGLLAAVRHPEIVVFGLKREIAANILKDLVQRIVVNNASFRANHVYPDIFVGHRAVFHELAPAQIRKYLGERDRKGYASKALQLIWPDNKDLFPWETGFEEHLRRLQPVTGLH